MASLGARVSLETGNQSAFPINERLVVDLEPPALPDSKS